MIADSVKVEQRCLRRSARPGVWGPCRGGNGTTDLTESAAEAGGTRHLAVVDRGTLLDRQHFRSDRAVAECGEGDLVATVTADHLRAVCGGGGDRTVLVLT
jgi:hypothetical protein